jgi:hypothetical protein
MLTGSPLNGTIVVPAAAPVSTTSICRRGSCPPNVPGTLLRDHR